MQFDWFTFGAQIFNFVILLLLLRRFLYRPITKAMAAREEKVAARFDEAEKVAAEAHREAELFHEKRLELEEQRSQMLAEVTAEAANQRKQLLHDARAEVDALRKGWYAAIEREKTLFLTELRHRVSKQVFAIARQALHDLADADLEEQIVAVFIQRLQRLDEEERTLLTQATARGEPSIVLRSAFALGATQRQQLSTAVAALLEETPAVTFDEEADLLCGIELQVYGHRIAWSLRNYIQSLEESLADLLSADHAHREGSILANDQDWRARMLAAQAYDV